MSASSNGFHRRSVHLPDGVDLHARPAGLLVRAAAQQHAAITLHANGREADATSILQVLALGATGGSDVEIEATGENASAALDAIAALIEALT
jgi:phosphotransferase system HPr (HPr) family protein